MATYIRAVIFASEEVRTEEKVAVVVAVGCLAILHQGGQRA